MPQNLECYAVLLILAVIIIVSGLRQDRREQPDDHSRSLVIDARRDHRGIYEAAEIASEWQAGRSQDIGEVKIFVPPEMIADGGRSSDESVHVRFLREQERRGWPIRVIGRR